MLSALCNKAPIIQTLFGTSVLELPSLPIYKKYKKHLITLGPCLIEVIIFFKKIKCCSLGIVKVASLCEKWSNITIKDKGGGNLRPELGVKIKIKQAVPCINSWGYVYKKFPLKSKMFSQLACYMLPKKLIWSGYSFYLFVFSCITSCLKEMTKSTRYKSCINTWTQFQKAPCFMLRL